MSYRDDVDTLYNRAIILQRELDAAREQIAILRGRRPETSPGIAELRELPDALQAHERLVDTSDLEDLSPKPMPNWEHIVQAPFEHALRVQTMIERVRENVALLEANDLVLVAKIVEELTDGKGGDEKLRSWLHWVANELAYGRVR